ncbi:MAG TPA: YciI family protein [Candidatus Limnocylindrales bacterium]|nr:YciI family protein [Candidatus Limnocylindrales bacterium]
MIAREEPEPVTDDVVEREVARQRWFWLLLLKRGPIRNQSRAEVDEIQAGHLRHLFTLRARGQLVLFGPVADAGSLRGIGVLTVATRADGEALMADDPAVRSGRIRAEVRPWFTMPGERLPD